jgi:hypothetical protein
MEGSGRQGLSSEITRDSELQPQQPRTTQGQTPDMRHVSNSALVFFLACITANHFVSSLSHCPPKPSHCKSLICKSLAKDPTLLKFCLSGCESALLHLPTPDKDCPHTCLHRIHTPPQYADACTTGCNAALEEIKTCAALHAAAQEGAAAQDMKSDL